MVYLYGINLRYEYYLKINVHLNELWRFLYHLLKINFFFLNHFLWKMLHKSWNFKQCMVKWHRISLCTITTIHIQNFLIIPSRNSVLKHDTSIPPPSSPWLSVFYFLTWWMWLFKAPHLSMIIQYFLFWVWIIPLSVMSSSFTHVVSELHSFL